MKRVVRALSIVGLILAGGGFFFGAFLAGDACCDSCPESMSIAVYAARNVLGYSLPGVLVAGLGWALCLCLLLRADQHRRAALVLAVLPLCALVSVVAVLVNNAGHLFPVHEGEIIRWERSLTWPFFLLLAWPILICPSTLALPRKAPH
jgi:hypothetical protein